MTTDDFWESDSRCAKACVPLAASQAVVKKAWVVPVGLPSIPCVSPRGGARQEEAVPIIVVAPGHEPARGNRQLEMLQQSLASRWSLLTPGLLLTLSSMPPQVHRGRTRSLTCQTSDAFSSPREAQSLGLGVSQGPQLAVARSLFSGSVHPGRVSEGCSTRSLTPLGSGCRWWAL